MSVARVTGSVGVLIALACTTPTDTCGCSEPLASALVTGSVTDSSGVALSDIVVSALAADAACTGPPVLVAQDSSDASGRFRLHVGLATRPADVCFDLVGRRPRGTGVDSVRVRDLRTTTAFVDPPELVVDLVFPVVPDAP